MIQLSHAARAAVVDFCAAVGTDPLLVQGAGGNVSWKEGATLWVKASGTWLAEAADKDIFVPTDLAQLREAIAAGQFAATPTVLGTSPLRPSIETMLHAVLPHPVVMHLHAIEVLAYLVRADWRAELSARLGNAVSWTGVPYHKPGAELAQAVSEALAASGADVVFLQNHGVVIGGADTAQVAATLGLLTSALATTPLAAATAPVVPAPLRVGDAVYEPIADADVQRLATDPALFARLPSAWALYPDHVVFLGAAAHLVDDPEALARQDADPELVFVRGVGVFAKPDFSKAKQLQLRCYFDVLVRQGDGAIQTLSMREIGELLNWDAERYRMSLSK